MAASHILSGRAIKVWVGLGVGVGPGWGEGGGTTGEGGNRVNFDRLESTARLGKLEPNFQTPSLTSKCPSA